MVKPTVCAAAAMLAMHIQSIGFLLIKIDLPKLPGKCNKSTELFFSEWRLIDESNSPGCLRGFTSP